MFCILWSKSNKKQHIYNQHCCFEVGFHEFLIVLLPVKEVEKSLFSQIEYYVMIYGYLNYFPLNKHFRHMYLRFHASSIVK